MNNNVIPASVRDAYRHFSLVLKSGQDAGLMNALLQDWRRIEKNPGDISAINALGLLAEKTKQYAVAELFFRYLLNLNPDMDIAHGNLANVLKLQGNTDAALISYEAALQINPKQVDYYLAVAHIYFLRGDNNHLISWLENALAHCHDSVALLVQMGEATKRTGAVDDALEYFRRALKLAPDVAYIHQTLAHTKKFIRHDEDVVAMEALLEDKGLSDEDRGRLNFSLGKVYEDLSDYIKSFEYYEQGNSLIRSGYNYCHEEVAQTFSRIEKIFERGLFEKYEGSGCKSEAPIFILSMPRSGSTLLEQMLASHTQVYGAGELALLTDIVNTLWARNVMPRGGSYPLGADTIAADVLSGAGEFYVNATKKLSGQDAVTRITDKMPHNFLYVGLIKLILPNARIIHCRRDPMDTCLSCFKLLFSRGHEYSYNLEDLGRYYGLYQKLMAHWHSVLPGFILDVDYESLIDDQAGQLQRILSFCDLPWEDACMSFHDSKNAAITASSVQVKQPLYKNAVSYWRRYEDFLGPLEKALTK